MCVAVGASPPRQRVPGTQETGPNRPSQNVRGVTKPPLFLVIKQISLDIKPLAH